MARPAPIAGRESCGGGGAGLLPRDKPSSRTALSLDRVPRSCAGGRSQPASQPSKEGNDRSRAALGPRSTAGRTSRLDRFPLLSDGRRRPTGLARGARSPLPQPRSVARHGRERGERTRASREPSPPKRPGERTAEGSHPPSGAPPGFASGVMLRRFPGSTPSCSARSPHGSGRSAPSRAASLSLLAAASVEAFPLDRAL